tara:strand:- start:25012 stop:26043 length:1032 start_codon:yes stop_codon:yes gene_type:complete
MNRVLLIICLGCVLFSCKAKKTIVSKHPKTRTTNTTTKQVDDNKEVIPPKVYANKTEKYIDTYSEIAKNEMSLYGIPASITLAQGVLESGSGHGTLSVKANNHFGIKCHDWTGAKVYHDDDEKQECFRKYKDAKYSFRDHSLFLTQRKRYGKLFKLKKEDYKGWAKGLKAAGYATDKKYPNKLISLIERYELYEFDREVLGESYSKYEEPLVVEKEDKDIIKSNNSTHIVSKGDTMYSIARAYNITVDELKNMNGLSDTTLSIGQELQIKKGLVVAVESVSEDTTVSEVVLETATHIVVKGDTLYSIAKKYNMTVEELQNINGLSDFVLSIGQELLVKPASKN